MQGTQRDDLIFSYTIDQATDDGILFDVRKVNPEWEKGLFSHVTTNLLSLGYLNADRTLSMPNLLDLLNQSVEIVRRESNGFTRADRFFSGSIELPDGSKQEVFVCQNETGKFTIMTPSDY